MTIVSLAAGVVLLVAFVFTERRVDQPLLPLHIVWDRARGGAYASIAIAGASVFAVFLFLTFFMQQNLGYSPLKTGVAFLPLTALIFIMAPTVQTQVLPRFGARPIIMTGMTLGAVAMLAFFAQLTPSSTYVAHVLPGLLIIGIGMPCIFAPSFATATLGVARYEAGVASAMVNTSQQVGGAVGTALLSTIFATAASSYASSHTRSPGLAAVRRGARLHDGVLLRRDLVRDRIPRRCPRAPSPHRAATAARRRTGDGDGLGAVCALISGTPRRECLTPWSMRSGRPPTGGGSGRRR